jgi:hypothetical protein
VPLSNEGMDPVVAVLAVSAITVLQLPDAPTELSIRYPVTAAPPLLAGAVQLKLTEPLPAVVTGEVGAPATVRGVTVDPTLSGLLPNEFIAATFTVYVRPFTNSVITQFSAPVFHVQVRAGIVGEPVAVAVAT